MHILNYLENQTSYSLADFIFWISSFRATILQIQPCLVMSYIVPYPRGHSLALKTLKSKWLNTLPCRFLEHYISPKSGIKAYQRCLKVPGNSPSNAEGWILHIASINPCILHIASINPCIIAFCFHQPLHCSILEHQFPWKWCHYDISWVIGLQTILQISPQKVYIRSQKIA